MTAGMDYLRGDLVGAATSIWGMGKKFMQHANYDSAAAEETRQRNFSPADVISFSGCKDDQTSADASEAGQATGAMSWAFLTVLNKYPQRGRIHPSNGSNRLTLLSDRIIHSAIAQCPGGAQAEVFAKAAIEQFTSHRHEFAFW